MKKYNDRNKTISKFLSLVLRHRPEVIDIKLDEQGWVDVKELIGKSTLKGRNFSMEELKEIITTNDKQRFALNEDETRIRANQGHSVKIELGLEPKSPPTILYHGTATKHVDSIRRQGLIKRTRQHVHLSHEKETAIKVGQRHGKVVVLKVKAQEMEQAGFLFFLSKNGVWLTDNVPPEFMQ